MSEQLSIDFARASGEAAMQACTEKAERDDPLFREKATAAILAHLRAVGQATGEACTDAAKAAGVRPKEDRSFGHVYRSLLDSHRIFIIGYAPRLKGHGCMGAKVYAIQH